MMSVARGLANIITDGSQIVGFPDWFTSAVDRASLRLRLGDGGADDRADVAVWRSCTTARTAQSLYAIGGSAEVARLSGISGTTADQLGLCGHAACSPASPASCSPPGSTRCSRAGLGYELDTIAAVVIGGASLSGGVGTIGGTAVGVLIIGVLRNGLNLLGVSPFIQQVIIGVVIALAVATDVLRRNRRRPGLRADTRSPSAHRTETDRHEQAVSPQRVVAGSPRSARPPLP